MRLMDLMLFLNLDQSKQSWCTSKIKMKIKRSFLKEREEEGIYKRKNLKRGKRGRNILEETGRKCEVVGIVYRVRKRNVKTK